MVRRRKPEIKGEDPNYSRTFERLRPVPTDMPTDTPPTRTIEKTDIPTEPKTEEPKVADAKPTKPAKTPATPRAKKPPKPATKPKAPVAATEPPKGDRQVTMDAAIKVDQAEAMTPLLEKGLKQRDIIMLAGRRATDQFVLSPEYLPKPEAERLPMSEGYHTSKRLDGAVLDKMRDEHDPLRVRSDPAMVRGQFETLFWKVLDDVIEELNDRYK